MRPTYETSASLFGARRVYKLGDTRRAHNHTLPYRKGLVMYDFCCLLYRLSTPALELMLQGEGDETRRELIEGEIEARNATP